MTQAPPPWGEQLQADPTDPYERSAQTFPVLPQEMVERASAYGIQEMLPAGTKLASPGDRGVDFFIVLDGTVGIYESGMDGVQKLVVRHDRYQFTGELDLLNDRMSLVSAVALEPTTVARLDRLSFRRLLTGEPDIAEIVMRAFILRRMGIIRHAHGSTTLLGPRASGESLDLQRLLTRNGYPVTFEAADAGEPGASLAQELGIAAADLPALVLPTGEVLRRPHARVVADAVGLWEPADPTTVHDVAIVGGGPGGLAAAVYAASEGLSTIVLEELAPGGQAGTSSRIENYLGFPTGISGQALAGRAHVQAQKFGARLAISRRVARLECDQMPFRLLLDDGTRVSARSLVIATGARYRRLGTPDDLHYEGKGIHYAATPMEGMLCADQQVVVVGGGNSAGQAAVFLSRIASHVHMLVRGEGLAATMSDYLVQRIASSPRITLHARTSVTSLSGDPYLRQVAWLNSQTGDLGTIEASNLFVMVGAEPNTDWLDGCVALDDRGFVLTGPAGGQATSPFESSRPGIFAIGDVRSASVKRVASAVGEGSVVVSAIHQYLGTL
ncbi:FAD-dependent oxidoreductase [Sphingomonas xinjiangensis]|uniref:Thioredoxin reductase n=1 Tax=Sphingomonas xinjiangensis TaxID=643568 RepID=A0A840YKT6_9SPHN|nr:FAD-dependent oxidoreductase [Sphingomonas xinjiangensis]MBB5711828.1 thioredoxin reductase (NADPH) [Sphingomonas xinjiangensis]